MRVLIDVDGVLLRQNIYVPQADCLVEAVLQVGGAKSAAEALSWDWVGRTDRDILHHALVLSAYERSVPLAELMDRATDVYLGMFRERCPEDLSDQMNEPVVTAVREAVEELGFSFAPVTGNLEPVARVKLHRAGVTPWLTLDVGSYGEGGSRPEILRSALEYDQNREYVYIGDTWRDMAAAQSAGVRFIGWETEKHRGELDEATWVARDTDELISALADAAWCETVA